MSAYTSIQLHRETKDHLAALGTKGESYESIIKRLLAYAEEYELSAEAKAALDKARKTSEDKYVAHEDVEKEFL